MMTDVLPLLLVAALVGAGLVTGLLFAFSNFMLDALAELDTEAGMFAMRLINRRIQNPMFFLLFFGTPLVCAAIAGLAALSPEQPERWWLIAGSALYLIGPLGITLMHNVPLNHKLEAEDWSNAERVWPAYRRRWQFWNHIRTLLGMLAFGALAIAAVAL